MSFVIAAILAAGPVAVLAQSASLQITAPADGAFVAPGQAITIDVQAGADVSSIDGISIIGTNPFGAVGPIFRPPFQFSLIVPTHIAVGTYLITAIANDTQGNLMLSPSVTLRVEPPVAPVQLTSEPSQLVLESFGEQSPLRIIGTFSDRSTQDVTKSSNMAYRASDVSVATIGGDGVVAAVGPGNASVFASYEGNLELTIPVTVLAPVITTSSPSLSFGRQSVGVPSRAQVLRLTNISNAPVNILSVSVVGDFSETDNCTSASPLPVAGTCTVNVTFMPSMPGTRSGTLTITNNARVVPVTLNLSGTGIGTPIALCRDITVQTDPGTCSSSNASIDHGSFDPDGDAVTVSQTPPPPYPLGTTAVTLTATDTEKLTSTCNASVTVVDKEPPKIFSISASPNVLWPPNKKMISVTVSVSASDNCDQNPVCKITGITSNESISSSDAQITGNLTASLLAERLGSGTGRTYTLAIQCTDASGNSSAANATVTVPHDQGS